MNDDGPAVRLRFVLGELEQVERAVDVDLVRGDRRELRPRRQQRREMKDQLDLELREDPLEGASIENRAGDLAIDLAGNRGIERREVERDDRALGLLGKAIDQSVADLAAGAGDEHDGFAHAQNYTEPSCIAFCRRMREPAASQQLAPPSFPCCGSPAPAREPPSPRVEASIFRRRCAWTTSIPAARKPERRFALDRVVNDGAWAGSRTQLVDDTNLGKYLFEVRAKPSRSSALLARLRVDLRRVGDDAGSEDRPADVPRVAAVPLAARAGDDRAQEAPARQQLSRTSGRLTSIRRRAS